MKITVQDFIQTFKNKKIINTKSDPDAVGKYIRDNLNIKTYIPFKQKRQIAEMVVNQNIKEVDGIKKNDQIDQYIGFIMSMISAHTDLQFSNDPISDYDLLSESGLLPQIIAEFQESYSECDVILKMVLAMELEDNNLNAIVGRFLNNILVKIDGVSDILKEKLEKFELKDLLGGDFKKEDLAKVVSFIDRLK